MDKLVFVLMCLLDALACWSSAQHHLRTSVGPWRHRIQWENNGQVFSLLSTGTQYRRPADSRRRTRFLLTRKNRLDHLSEALSRSIRNRYPGQRDDHADSAVLGADVNQYLLASRNPETQSEQAPYNATVMPEFSGSGIPRGGRSTTAEAAGTYPTGSPGSTHGGAGSESAGSLAGSPAPGVAVSEHGGDATSVPQQSSHGEAPSVGSPHSAQSLNRVSPELIESPTALISNVVDTPTNMGRSDPRDPHSIHHRNSVFYDIYPPDLRNRFSAQPVPGTGHGTRLFFNGLPDLVPDPYYIQTASYIEKVQMYALRCAAEENCLSRSAYHPNVSDLHYRVLLRFPQRVKNQGTSDFLPKKSRHEWKWHTCHQHFHSMEEFSTYNLLDASTGQKVAEGHKASFCLEDTSCDPGVRRRFACTSHTQGLSPGCYDTYHADIDCQWIDITDVPPGNYKLKVMVNPSQLILESNFSNNEAQCDIMYTGSFVEARNCYIVGNSPG